MRKIELTIPRSWQELTLSQLRIVAAHSLLQLPKEESAIILFCKLAGVRIVQQPSVHGKPQKGGLLCKTHNGVLFELEPWQMAEFGKQLDWYFNEIPFNIVCPLKCDRNLVDVTFGAYFHADALLFGAQNNGDLKMVRQACADLGDKRKITHTDAMMVQLWWRGFKQWLAAEYPDVFMGGNDDGEAHPDNFYSPIKIRQNIMLLLNDGHPQDNDRIEQSNVHDVLSALQHHIEVAKKEEEMMKKYRR